MKLNETYYYCFGCHLVGDVIDFTGRLFSLSPLEAAQKLASDFGIDPHTPASASLAVPRPPAKSPLEQERRCASALLDYEYLLKHRQQQFAPSHDADKWDERFVSATHSLPQVSYLIDCLHDADAALRKQTADSLLNDGTLHKIEKWNIAHRKEVLPCEENDTLAA